MTEGQSPTVCWVAEKLPLGAGVRWTEHAPGALPFQTKAEAEEWAEREVGHLYSITEHASIDPENWASARLAMNETAMRAWWVSDYECYAGRTAQEAFDAAVKDWGGLDDISETVDDVIEAGASETMDLGEDGEGPIVNIRAHAATMGDAGFICGIDG